MSQWLAPNPNWQEATRRFLMDMPLAQFLALELALPEPGRSELTMPYRRELAFRDGFLQAGAVGTVGDLAAGLSCYTMLSAGYTTATIDYTLKLVAPAAGDRLVALGRLVQPGQAISVGAAEVWSVKGETRRLTATLLCTMHNYRMPPAREDRPPR